MAAFTKFYLLGDDPLVQPTVWQGTNWIAGAPTSSQVNGLDPLKEGFDNSIKSRTDNVSTNPVRYPCTMHVSTRTLKAQTFGGTLDLVAAVQEENADAQMFWKVYAYVTVGRTTAVRGVLLDYEDNTVEWTTTSTGTALPAPQALAALTVQAGDRLVVELGFVSTNAFSTSRFGRIRIGGMTTSSGITGQADLSVGSTNTANEIGYILFSQAVELTDPPANDDIENATVLTGSAVHTVDMRECTRQASDPNTFCKDFGSPFPYAHGRYNTPWFAWQCPVDQSVTVTAEVLNTLFTFWTTLGVFVGTIGSLAQFDCSANNDPDTESVTFAATAGTTYFFSVGTEQLGGGTLTFTFTPGVEPSAASETVQPVIDADAAFDVMAHTVMGWINLTAANAAHRHFYYMAEGSSPFVPGEPYIWIGTDVDGLTLTLNVYDGITVYEFSGPTLALNTWYHWVYVKSGDSHSVYLSTEAGTPLNASLAIGPVTQTSNLTNAASQFIYGTAGSMIPKAFKCWAAVLTVAEMRSERETYRAVRHADCFSVSQFKTSDVNFSGGQIDYSGYDNRIGNPLLGSGLGWETVRGPLLATSAMRPYFDDFEAYLPGYWSGSPTYFPGTIDAAENYEFLTQPSLNAFIVAGEGYNATQGFKTVQQGHSIWFEHDAYTGRCGFVSFWSYKDGDDHGAGASIESYPDLTTGFGFANSTIDQVGLPGGKLRFFNTFESPTELEVAEDVYVANVWQLFKIFFELSTVNDTLDGINADGTVTIQCNGITVFQRSGLRLATSTSDWPMGVNTWNAVGQAWSGVIDELTIGTACIESGGGGDTDTGDCPPEVTDITLAAVTAAIAPCITCASVTAQTIINMVTRRLGDRGRLWTEAEVLSHLIRGYRELTHSTRLVWERASISGFTTNGVVTLDSKVLEIDRVEWEGRMLDPLNPAHLTISDPMYEQNSGNVYGYTWRKDGIMALRLVNRPVTGSPDVEYWRLGNTVTIASESFELPGYYERYLQHYALARCYHRNGPGQDHKLGGHYDGRWKRDLSRIMSRITVLDKQYVGRMGGSGPARSYPGRPKLPWNYGSIVR